MVPSLRRWVRSTSVVKASLSFWTGRTGLADILVVEKTMQGALADFGVNLAVVFHLDPGQGGFVELIQSQIGDSFEHGQQPAFDLRSKRLSCFPFW